MYVKRADGIVIDNSSMNIPTLIIKYASNNVGLYKVDSTPTTDPASPDYTGKVKQITDENGNIEYYLGINASDIITTGTALSINITAEANNTSSKVVIYDPATEQPSTMTTGATYKAIREVTLDPSLNDGPTELSIRVIAEDGVTS